MPYLMIISCQERYLKIDATRRRATVLAQAQSGSPHELSLVKLLYCKDAEGAAAKIHSRLSHFHLRNNWFELPLDEAMKVVHEVMPNEKSTFPAGINGEVDRWSKYAEYARDYASKNPNSGERAILLRVANDYEDLARLIVDRLEDESP